MAERQCFKCGWDLVRFKVDYTDENGGRKVLYSCPHHIDRIWNAMLGDNHDLGKITNVTITELK